MIKLSYSQKEEIKRMSKDEWVQRGGFSKNRTMESLRKLNLVIFKYEDYEFYYKITTLGMSVSKRLQHLHLQKCKKMFPELHR